jgi:hypothetical protein
MIGNDMAGHAITEGNCSTVGGEDCPGAGGSVGGGVEGRVECGAEYDVSSVASSHDQRHSIVAGVLSVDHNRSGGIIGPFWHRRHSRFFWPCGHGSLQQTPQSRRRFLCSHWPPPGMP